VNTRNKIIAGFVVVTAAALAASAQASDGTITINGKITSQTCTIAGNGAGKSFTVTLPTVAAGALAVAGDVAGRTGFTIGLSGCSTKSGNVSAFFEPGTSIDSTTNRLKNTSGDKDAATNVQIQITNSDGTPIQIGQAGDQKAATATVDSTLGAATMNYAAQYVATGASTSGAVSTSIVYSIRYN
jgi:major type 1 subunit fimbrin (pilin)